MNESSVPVALRPEREDDRAFLRRLHAELRPQFGADDPVWRVLVDQQYVMQERHYRSAYPGAEYWIVEEAGLPIGRLYFHESETAIRVLDITLLPNARGRGVGTALIRQVIDRASARALDVALSVEAANPARRLYERMGFAALDAAGPIVEMVRRHAIEG